MGARVPRAPSYLDEEVFLKRRLQRARPIGPGRLSCRVQERTALIKKLPRNRAPPRTNTERRSQVATVRPRFSLQLLSSPKATGPTHAQQKNSGQPA